VIVTKDDDRIRDRFRGCLLGAALGSALGFPLEGVPIAKRAPNAGSALVLHDGVTGAISADAQLMMFTAEGLIRAEVRSVCKGICHPPSVVRQAYLRWLATQGITGASEPLEGPNTGWLSSVKALHRRRGPGKGTIEALQKADIFNISHSANTSKGNGALTRIAPVGLIANEPFKLAMEIAALTHGHVTGWLAPAFFAKMLHELAVGASIEAAVARGRAPVEENHCGDEVLIALDRAAMAATQVRIGADPRTVVRTLGRGRTADEALQIALFCVYTSRGVREALSLSVAHDGDTDATATLVGAVLGAVGGVSALPADWLAGLELRKEIETLADDLFRAPREDVESADWWAKYPGY
jgi:ADP-ribosylglycohydrolase